MRLNHRARYRSTAQPTTKPCMDCGQPYATKTVVNSGVCKRCQERRYGKNHRSRAKRYGVPYEPIDVRDVFERDGWICGICSEPVDREAKAPHPNSASLDHVIPMARGGGHLYENVQCAHFLCNSLKGARLESEAVDAA